MNSEDEHEEGSHSELETVSFAFDRMTVARFRERFRALAGTTPSRHGRSLAPPHVDASTAGWRVKLPAELPTRRSADATPTSSNPSSALT